MATKTDALTKLAETAKPTILAAPVVAPVTKTTRQPAAKTDRPVVTVRQSAQPKKIVAPYSVTDAARHLLISNTIASYSMDADLTWDQNLNQLADLVDAALNTANMQPLPVDYAKWLHLLQCDALLTCTYANVSWIWVNSPKPWHAVDARLLAAFSDGWIDMGTFTDGIARKSYNSDDLLTIIDACRKNGESTRGLLRSAMGMGK